MSPPPAQTPPRPARRAEVSPTRPAPLLALPARSESNTPAPTPVVAPVASTETPRPLALTRPRVLVPMAFLLGGMTAYGVHLLTRESPRGAVPVVVEAPTPPLPRTTLTGAPPWATGASRAWRGTLDGDGSAWTFSLVLVLDNTGSVSGRFAWTASHAAGAHPGDQVTEHVSGTYEPTLNTLELTGVRSTNSVLFPVNAYRLQVLPDGGIVGATVGSTTTHLVGTVLTLPR